MSRHLIAEFEEIEELTNEVEEQEIEEEVSQDLEDQDTPENDNEFEIPDKFKGKSTADIVRSYQELEKTLGRQAQELGEYRKYADSFLRQELERTSTGKATDTKEEEIDFSLEDFVSNPKETLGKAVEPKVKQLSQELSELKREAALKEFQSKHPDYMDIGTDPDFQEWVAKSPYRIRQFQAANQYDLDAADELLSQYKEIQSLIKQKKEEEINTAKKEAKAKIKKDLKASSLESGSTGQGTRTVYRKADLIRMRMEDPDRFNAMHDEILQAYAEGRVK